MSRRRKQCKKCPWKVGTNPHEIPGGYCTTKHQGLSSTIAKEASLQSLSGPLHMMACHETTGGHELTCVGWLHHQLGVGNNLPLRLAVAFGKVDADYELVGAQHQTFEGTLPPEVRS